MEIKNTSLLTEDISYSARWFSWWNLGIVIGLTTMLLVLSHLYASNIKELITIFDFWFGNDTVRYIQWINNPDYIDRYHLHPLSFILYRSFGSLLINLNILPDFNLLPLLSLPVVLYTSFSIVFAVNILLPNQIFPHWIRFIGLLLLLLIGPILVFAPVPESHVLGGTSLLMQAVLTWNYLNLNYSSDLSPEETIKKQKRILLAIIIFAILATGFTLSNLMPAVILLLAVPKIRPLIIKLGFLIASLLIFMYIIHHYIYHFEFISPIRRNIMEEINWLNAPNLNTLTLSLKNFLLSQFGLSSPFISSYQSSPGDVHYLLALSSPTVLQISAFIFYVIGILYWLFQRTEKRNFENMFILICTISFLSLMAFHNVYAVNESYIFSAHGWPFLVLPGLLVLKNSWIKRDFKPIYCLVFAVVLSGLQMIIGIYGLMHLAAL